MNPFDAERADPRSIPELIEAALAAVAAGDETNGAVVALQARSGAAVLVATRDLAASPDRRRRLLATRILGELGLPGRDFPEECCDLLLALLHDPDPEVGVSAAFALGHLGARRADPALIALSSDPRDDMRHAVAFALAGATEPESVAALLTLMSDANPLARDWATTAIGGATEIDGPKIRAALFARSTDPDAFTRAEALKGLARRRDERAIPWMIDELRVNGCHVDGFAEAALEMLGLEPNVAPPGDAGGSFILDNAALVDMLLKLASAGQEAAGRAVPAAATARLQARLKPPRGSRRSRP